MKKNQSARQLMFSAWNKARQEIVSPWLRRYRSRLFQGYILVALLLFAVLAFLANTGSLLGIDLEFTRELQAETPTWFGYLLQAVSWPGYAIPAVVIIAVVLIFLGMVGLRWEAITTLTAAGSSGLLNNIVKYSVGRPRPTSDLVDVVRNLNSYSFPSGHVMFYVTFMGFLLFLTYTLLKNTWRRVLLSLVLVALIVLVGPSRMFLGEHWASDVAGGYLLGSLNLILIIQFYHWGKKRFAASQPVAPEDSDNSSDLHIREEAQMFNTPIPITSKKDESHEHHSDRPG